MQTACNAPVTGKRIFPVRVYIASTRAGPNERVGLVEAPLIGAKRPSMAVVPATASRGVVADRPMTRRSSQDHRDQHERQHSLHGRRRARPAMRQRRAQITNRSEQSAQEELSLLA